MNWITLKIRLVNLGKNLTLNTLEYRMNNNWTMFLFGSGRTGEVILVVHLELQVSFKKPFYHQSRTWNKD